MSLHTIQKFLLICLAFNYSLIIIWFLLFTCWHDGLFRLHKKWFKISEQLFDAMNYVLMSTYKLAIFIFNLVPCIAISLIT